MKDPLLLLEVS